MKQLFTLSLASILLHPTTAITLSAGGRKPAGQVAAPSESG